MAQYTRDFGDEDNSDLVLNTQSFFLLKNVFSLPEFHCSIMVFSQEMSVVMKDTFRSGFVLSYFVLL